MVEFALPGGFPRHHDPDTEGLRSFDVELRAPRRAHAESDGSGRRGGNMEWMSSVAVNSTEICRALDAIASDHRARRSWVLSVTWAEVSSSTVVAPRSARTPAVWIGRRCLG